ncbi:MAG TPA: hypothetical protein QF753_14995 [Victivallales bacterium]|nr:hypothetical protein [Victivallales bacterium]
MFPDKINELIIVACHAAFKGNITLPIKNPAGDGQWVLFPFQQGEPKYYLEHMKHGIELLKRNENSILMFSGGHTRKDSGNWTEASSYLQAGLFYNLWADDASSENSLANRIILEEYARDSFENLLFSICKFYEVTDIFPGKITLISWDFKKTRFILHCESIGYSVNNFSFSSVNNPEDIETAVKGEKDAVNNFKTNLYGSAGNLLKKRNERNPFNKTIPYYNLDLLNNFFIFINDPVNRKCKYQYNLPWHFEKINTDTK